MSDPRPELADLVLDLIAVVEDAAARGVVAEVVPARDPASARRDAGRPASADGDPTPSSSRPPARRGPAPPARSSPPPARPTPPITAPPDDVVVDRRREAWAQLADQARTDAARWTAAGAEALRRIREDLGDCRRCGLYRQRRTIVFGAGAPDADLAIVGEAPGHQEDLQGVPFVGPAGQMLDRMLENVLGLSRAEVHILNVVKCRPPSNRNPNPDEVEACLPFLERQLDAIQPKVILVLGTVALKVLFGTPAGITRHRGVWREFRGIPSLPTFHPAYLLRNPEHKRVVFEDLKSLRARYDEVGGRRASRP